MKADNIAVLPFRMEYDKTNDSIFMERHRFIRESQFGGKVIGMEKKSTAFLPWSAPSANLR
jgi:hypothetical protein